MRWLGLLVVLVAGTASAKSSNPAFLGVQMDDVGTTRGIGPCMVTAVTKDSAAESAGLRSGDVFVTMDGKVVVNCDGLVTAIQARSPGDVVKLVVSRSARDVKVDAVLMSRDEILRKRFGGMPVPSTMLVRVDDKRPVDISSTNRQTTILGWFPTTCTNCDQIFTTIDRWSREDRKTMPIRVAAATAGDIRMRRSVTDNLELLKPRSKLLDVPLLLADPETYENFAIGTDDRVQFMVIDCRGIVQYTAPLVPDSEDVDAVLDELYAAAEQAARRMK